MQNRKSFDEQARSWADLAKKNDLDAFNHLVVTHQDAAFNFASWMLNGDDVADDVVQTAFLAAYRHIQGFRGTSFRAWLLKIIRNLCIDELRRRVRHPWTQIGPKNADEPALEETEWLIDPSPLPEELIIKQEEQRLVESCICQLPDLIREVLILIDIQELNYKEAAMVLNIPVGTIKSRLARARVHLRDLLSKKIYSSAIPDRMISVDPVYK